MLIRLWVVCIFTIQVFAADTQNWSISISVGKNTVKYSVSVSRKISSVEILDSWINSNILNNFLTFNLNQQFTNEVYWILRVFPPPFRGRSGASSDARWARRLIENFAHEGGQEGLPWGTSPSGGERGAPSQPPQRTSKQLINWGFLQNRKIRITGESSFFILKEKIFRKVPDIRLDYLPHA